MGRHGVLAALSLSALNLLLPFPADPLARPDPSTPTLCTPPRSAFCPNPNRLPTTIVHPGASQSVPLSVAPSASASRIPPYCAIQVAVSTFSWRAGGGQNSYHPGLISGHKAGRSSVLYSGAAINQWYHQTNTTRISTAVAPRGFKCFPAGSGPQRSQRHARPNDVAAAHVFG